MNKARRDARRSLRVARQVVNSILYVDTICLKHIENVFSLTLLRYMG